MYESKISPLREFKDPRNRLKYFDFKLNKKQLRRKSRDQKILYLVVDEEGRNGILLLIESEIKRLNQRIYR